MRSLLRRGMPAFLWALAALASTGVAARGQTATQTSTATRVLVPTRTATGTDTFTPSRTPTRTASVTRTATAVDTPTRTRTATPASTPTRTASATAASTATRTASGTRTTTPTNSPPPPFTPTRTATATHSASPTRSNTPTASATAPASFTPTPQPAFVSVELVANRSGDNGDGTLTTLIAALVSDANGHTVGDGIAVAFALSPPVAGVTVTQLGNTGELPACDISAYEVEMGRAIAPQPGTAYTCLRYVRSREGVIVTVSAQLGAGAGAVQGSRSIRLPPATTPVPTATAVSTATPTPSESATATASETVTEPPTVTETPLTPPATATITATRTETAVPTVTNTPLAPIRVVATAGAARPGDVAFLRFDLVDRTESVFELSFDVLIDTPVFAGFQVTARCRTSPSLTSHQLSASVQFDSVPPGRRRFRFVLVDVVGAPDQLRAGPVVDCSLPVAVTAPLGPTTITVDRVLAGDEHGTSVSGTIGVDGTLLIDPEAPLSTPTVTVTETRTSTGTPTVSPTPTATATGSSTATATPTPSPTDTPLPTGTATAVPTATDSPSPSATPPPSPTATPPRCAGDCNGDGIVVVSELVTAVRISLEAASVAECPAVDRNGSGTVTIDELIAAVNNAAAGCG